MQLIKLKTYFYTPPLWINKLNKLLVREILNFVNCRKKR